MSDTPLGRVGRPPKLSVEDVDDVLKRLDAGEPHQRIAIDKGVSRETICRINRMDELQLRRTYGYVQGIRVTSKTKPNPPPMTKQSIVGLKA